METQHTPRRDAPRAGRTESQSPYWRAHHRDGEGRAGASFADYEAAYRTGYEGQAAYGGRFEDAEVRLRSHYETRPGAQRLGWDDGAALACRAAWDLAERWRGGDAGQAGH